MNKSILIAIPCLKVGGTEIQTLRLVEALTDNGYHCVTVCYFEYDFAMRQRFEEAGSKVVCLSAFGQRPAGQWNVYRFLKSGLKRVVDEYRPKIAHVQYMAPGAIPIFILRRLGLKTIVATLHTDAGIYKSLKLIHFLQRHVTTAFTCVTETAEKNFFGDSHLFGNDDSLGRHNHFTIHNCLPKTFHWFDSQEIQRQPHTPPVIGVVSRLEHIKGVDFILPAFAKVLRYFPDCRLMIVGDGKLREQMLQQQHELSIPAAQVIWTGRVAYERLAECYRQMHLVWIPSRSEGFGLSAVEAMANGHIVIASATGGLNEIIHDGIDSLLFPCGDTDALASKTNQLLSNPDRLFQMSTAALESSKQYTFEKYKKKIASLYKQLSDL